MLCLAAGVIAGLWGNAGWILHLLASGIVPFLCYQVGYRIEARRIVYLALLLLFGGQLLGFFLALPIQTGSEDQRGLTGGSLFCLFVWVILVGIPAAESGVTAAREERLRGHCPACEYDLTGNTSGRCPECGHVIG